MRFFSCAKRMFGLIFLVLLLSRGECAGAAEESVAPALLRSPGAQIRKSIDDLQRVLRDETLHPDARKERIREVVAARLDMHELARRMLGGHWLQDSALQHEFIALLTRVIERLYMDKLDKLAYARVEVLTEKIMAERGYTDYVEVWTRMGSGIYHYTVIFRMHEVLGEWKIFDIAAEGVSLARNYRAQFDKLLKNESFESLLERMREKVSAY